VVFTSKPKEKTPFAYPVAGTCTDVHESIQTKIEAKRTREQLLSVITLSQITMFTVDSNHRVTMLEGALIWDSHCDDNQSRWYIGEDVYEVFNRLNAQLPEGQMPPFLKPLESILSGEAAENLQEHEIGRSPPSAEASCIQWSMLILVEQPGVGTEPAFSPSSGSRDATRLPNSTG
jgi:hypothetical protein